STSSFRFSGAVIRSQQLVAVYQDGPDSPGLEIRQYNIGTSGLTLQSTKALSVSFVDPRNGQPSYQNTSPAPKNPIFREVSRDSHQNVWISGYVAFRYTYIGSDAFDEIAFHPVMVEIDSNLNSILSETTGIESFDQGPFVLGSDAFDRTEGDVE